MPKETENAEFVYVEIDNPQNLGVKFAGPFPIISRPTNTTVTIRVGYTKEGLAREETHHWSRLRVAHLRPDAEPAVRPRLGRPRRDELLNVNNKILAPNTQPNNFSQLQRASPGTGLTQPLNSNDGTRPSQQPAEPANFGWQTYSHPHDEALSGQIQITGAPPMSPFGQQKQQQIRQPAPTSTSTPDPKPVTREPLPRQASGGLAPPVTKGAPQSSGSSSNLAPASPEQASQQVLHDHDYFRRPSAVLDHDYAAPGPPPGFENYQSGRPRRNINPPARFSDYDTS